MRSTLVLAATAGTGVLAALAFAPWWLVGAIAAGLTLGGVLTLHDRRQVRRAPIGAASADGADLLQQHHQDAVLLLSESGRLQVTSASVHKLLGWGEAELRAMSFEQLVHPDDVDATLAAYRAVKDTADATTTVDVQVRTAGSWLPVALTITNRVRSEGGYIVHLRDARQRQVVSDRLERRQAQMHATAAVARHALDGSDEATLVAAAVALAREALAADGCEIYRTTGTAPELVAGVGPGGLHMDRRSTTMTGAALAANAAESLGTAWELDGRVVTTDDPGCAATAIASPIGAQDGADGALIARTNTARVFDETDVAFLTSVAGLIALARRRRGAEQAAFRRSRHDALTGLVNKDVFVERLQTSIRRSGAPGECIAVLLIDLDHFKIINDSLGHAAGDALIEAVSERLGEGLRPGDTLARFSGDEFVVLARRLGDPDHAILAAERLRSVLVRPFSISGHDVLVTASVGVATCSDNDAEAGSVLQEADAALYHAKALGRERVTLFEPTLLDAAVTRLRVEEELREALASEQLRVFYQPIVNLGTGNCTHVEALVRWVHPRRGLVSPADFIPISEATGLIGDIGAWVINEVARQAAHWQSQGTPLRVSVNLSTRQLADPTLVSVFVDRLAAHNVDPSALAVEVTEQSLMADPETASQTLRDLSALGIGLVIDDFGTGYASMPHLRDLPVDMVKIDQSFVEGIARSGADYAVASAIIQLARVAGTQVVAEGVETEQQLELLRDLGCDLAQGFLFSPAVFDLEASTHDRDWTQPVYQHHN